jgi:predicted outer membrane repeat protein
VWDSVEIRNSTIISNTASNLDNTSKGGGIYASDHTLTLINTTISGNTAEQHGGGIFANGLAVVQMANVTLSNNTADANNDADGLGGGFYQDSSSVIRAKNSIIAGNKDLQSSAFEIYAPDCYGTLTSDGFNLLGLDNFLCTVAGDLTGMQAGVASPGLDPKLGRLTFYAAEYYYHPVLFGPAVDRGNPAGCKDYANVTLAIDQIGQIRPYTGSGSYTPRCDLGAVESGFKRFDLYLPQVDK